jgi:hypothetical protein
VLVPAHAAGGSDILRQVRSRAALPSPLGSAGYARARSVYVVRTLALMFLTMVPAVWPCDHLLFPKYSARLAADAVKEPLRGLISMGAYKFAPALGEPDNSLDTVREKNGLLQGIVILASWRSLERSPTSGLADNNEIDQGLANVRKYNQDNPKAPLAVKIRVWGGFWAPDWVMEDSGGKIPVVHTNFRGVSKDRTLGHVWDDRYHLRWAHLQELLAARYDSDPLVHEVAVTSCMMFTAEPFSMDTRPPAVDPLRKAGMNDANYQGCLNKIVDDYAP